MKREGGWVGWWEESYKLFGDFDGGKFGVLGTLWVEEGERRSG